MDGQRHSIIESPKTELCDKPLEANVYQLTTDIILSYGN